MSLPKKARRKMVKHYCDICGKEMQDKEVRKETDPLDYIYGECAISVDIGFQGIYEVGFEEICHECEKRIVNIDMDDFHIALKRLMRLGHLIVEESEDTK